jgi:hypothetical protein
MIFRLWKLLPGQKAIINIRFTEIVKIVDGAYCYNLPTFLMPDYSKHDVRNKDSEVQNTYSFKYKLKISSSQQITDLNLPKGVTFEKNPEKNKTIIKGNKTARRLKFFSRTS